MGRNLWFTWLAYIGVEGTYALRSADFYMDVLASGYRTRIIGLALSAGGNDV